MKKHTKNLANEKPDTLEDLLRRIKSGEVVIVSTNPLVTTPANGTYTCTVVGVKPEAEPWRQR